MATLDDLSNALVKADAAGNVEDARKLAAAIRQMEADNASQQPAYADLDDKQRYVKDLIDAAVRDYGVTEEEAQGIFDISHPVTPSVAHPYGGGNVTNIQGEFDRDLFDDNLKKFSMVKANPELRDRIMSMTAPKAFGSAAVKGASDVMKVASMGTPNPVVGMAMRLGLNKLDQAVFPEQTKQIAEEVYPTSTTAGQIVGETVPFLPAGAMMAVPRTVAGRIGAGAALGAAEGGAPGIGRGDPLEQVVPDMLVGTAFGAGATGLIEKLAKVGAKPEVIDKLRLLESKSNADDYSAVNKILTQAGVDKDDYLREALDNFSSEEGAAIQAKVLDSIGVDAKTMRKLSLEKQLDPVAEAFFKNRVTNYKLTAQAATDPKSTFLAEQSLVKRNDNLNKFYQLFDNDIAVRPDVNDSLRLVIESRKSLPNDVRKDLVQDIAESTSLEQFGQIRRKLDDLRSQSTPSQREALDLITEQLDKKVIGNSGYEANRHLLPSKSPIMDDIADNMLTNDEIVTRMLSKEGYKPRDVANYLDSLDDEVKDDLRRSVLRKVFDDSSRDGKLDPDVFKQQFEMYENKIGVNRKPVIYDIFDDIGNAMDGQRFIESLKTFADIPEFKNVVDHLWKDVARAGSEVAFETAAHSMGFGGVMGIVRLAKRLLPKASKKQQAELKNIIDEYEAAIQKGIDRDDAYKALPGVLSPMMHGTQSVFGQSDDS